MVYNLVKELAWETVDNAWCAKEVANWKECDFDDGVASRRACKRSKTGLGVVRVQTVSSVPVAPKNGGGGEGGKSKRSKKKNKLPGVSATQKSVADFFSVRVNVTEPLVPQNVCSNEDEYMLLSEARLSQEYRLEMVRRLKLRWVCEQSAVCAIPESEEDGLIMLKGGEGLMMAPEWNENVIHNMRQHQIGGEVSEESISLVHDEGGTRPDIIASPLSRRVIQKSRSVASIKAIFSNEKGDGVNSPVGVQAHCLAKRKTKLHIP